MRALALLLLVAGCLSPPEWTGDPDLFGVDLVVADASPAYATNPDARPRLKRVLDLTSRYLGHRPEELSGMRLILRPGDTAPCGNAGCCDWSSNTITVTTDTGNCIESLCIPHELLHYYIGDPEHSDPRWRQMNAFLPTLLEGDCSSSFVPCEF